MKTNKIPPIFFKYFKSSSSHEGFTLMELLVAFLMIGIILAFATSASVNMYRAENKLNAKNNRRAELTRALAYMENEIQSATQVETETGGNCNSAFDTGFPCLKLTFPANFVDPSDNTRYLTQVIYGFDTINTIPQTNTLYIWSKPGLLKKRKRTTVIISGTDEGFGNATVLVDGLAIANIPATNCDPSLATTPNGANGFRFCLGNETAPKKRVQIFLYGYAGINEVGVADDPIALNNLTFAQSN